MKLYNLNYSVGDDVGCQPQIEERPESNLLYDNLIKWSRSFDIDKPTFKEFLLVKKANPTDFVSVVVFNTSYLLIISEKLLTLLDDFNINPHVVFKIDMVKGEKRFDNYYLLKYSSSAAQYVNAEKSEFYIYNRKTKEKEPITLSQHEMKEFIEGKNNFSIRYPKYLHAAKLVFNRELDLDLFSLGKLGIHSIVSEKLKFRLLEEGISGIDFSELGEGIGKIHGYSNVEEKKK